MEEHDHKQRACISIKKKTKPLAKSSWTKQSCKSWYTIFEGSLDERRGKPIKVEINASLSKIRSIFGWK